MVDQACGRSNRLERSADRSVPLGDSMAARLRAGMHPRTQRTYKEMRKLLLAAAIGGTLMLPALAADERNFTIVNGTGYELSFIGVNPPGDNDFGDNELGAGLADGASVYVKFNGADKGCIWNIKVKWSGYSEQVFFEGLDLCRIEKVTLKYDRDTKKTTAFVE
jgi:hypothetical protein